jgi:hypothetical protein
MSEVQESGDNPAIHSDCRNIEEIACSYISSGRPVGILYSERKQEQAITNNIQDPISYASLLYIF